MRKWKEIKKSVTYKINDSKVRNSLSSVCFEYVLLYFIQDWLVELEPQVQILWKLCWEKLTCLGMSWYQLCVQFFFLSSACPVCVSFLQDDMNFKKTQISIFCTFSEIILSEHDSLWCMWSTIRVHQVTTFLTPTPYPNTREEGKERKRTLCACWGCCLSP